ncbi:hypothetical protein [Bdellovibrio sp. ArHS]|uniref:beta strand repeat-containing protein n=1 Tax=Bdellovibrio sp. ArHS TaxID=1569284 RepID=UPI000A6E1896|nr:hypothetical protein [Bdellovibrio sp. ArHS]
MRNSVTLLLLVLLQSFSAFAQIKGYTFQGSIKRPDGTLPTVTGLTVNLKILNPAGCVLRDEDITGVNITNGYFTLVVGKGTPTGDDPGKTIQQVFNNAVNIASGLNCLDASNNVIASNQGYNPGAADTRKLRMSLELDGNPIVMDFNMRSVPFATNSETLNGFSDANFIKTSANITQTAVENWFSGAVMGQLSGGTYNAPSATTAVNVTGTVAIANGGTGATSAAAARTNLGLGALSTMTPTGTPDGTKFLRDDGVWTAVAGGGGAVTSVAGKTGAVSLVAADITDFNTVTDARILAQMPTFSGDVSGAYNATSVDKIKGKTVSAAPTTAGQVFRYDGTDLVPSFLSMFDLRSTVTGASTFGGGAAGCTAGQTLTWTAATDNLSCTNIAITSGQVSGLAASATTDVTNAANISAGTLPAGRMPALTGDVTTTAGSVGTTIANNAVTSAKIADSAVTAAKLGSDVGSWSTDGTNVYRLSGKVGIGTNSPSSELSIVKDGNDSSLSLAAAGTGLLSGRINSYSARGTMAAPTVSKAQDVGFKAFTYFYDGSTYREGTGIMGILEQDAASDSVPSSLVFRTNAGAGGFSTERVRITSAGNVGIGSVSPTAKLEVNGAAGATLKIVDTNQGAGKVLTSDANGVASWAVAGGAWVTSAKTANYTVTTADKSTYFKGTGSITFTLPAAATAGAGFMVGFKNAGTGTVTVQANGAETINTVNSVALYQYDTIIIICDGTSWDYFTSSSNSGSPTFNTALPFSTPGSTTFTIPAGVTRIRVSVLGAGGNGASGVWAGGGAGGGGGGYAHGVFSVTPGAQYTVTVGAGGAGGAGGTSSFGSLISATGGQSGINTTGGAGGTGTGGSVQRSGGSGGNGYTGNTSYSGGGGGSGGGFNGNGANGLSSSGNSYGGNGGAGSGGAALGSGGAASTNGVDGASVTITSFTTVNSGGGGGGSGSCYSNGNWKGGNGGSYGAGGGGGSGENGGNTCYGGGGIGAPGFVLVEY